MNNNRKRAFTLVEILAVIVVLGIILVMVMPSITKIVDNSKMGTIKSSAKLLASSAENYYRAMEASGERIETTLTGNKCLELGNIDSNEYDVSDTGCIIKFDTEGKATVTLKGKVNSKFDGQTCTGTRDSMHCAGEPKSFAEDSWETIKVAAVSGNLSKYKTDGTDKKTIHLGGSFNKDVEVRLVNTSTTGCGTADFSETACGVVLEFENTVVNHTMNGTSADDMTNAGGWPASEMREYLNNDFYNALPNDIKSIIINTKIVSGHEAGKTDNYVSTDKLYLLTPTELGTTHKYDSAKDKTKVLDYYKNSAENNDIRKKTGTSLWYWLRVAYSNNNSYFLHISSSGVANSNYSYNNFGVAPAFRIA